MLLVAALAGALLSALPAAPARAVAAPTPAAAVTLAAGGGTVVAGQDLAVSGTVTNLGTRAIEAGSLRIGLSPDAADRAGLERALADPASATTERAASAAVPALGPGATVPINLTVPAADLGRILTGAGWGAHVLTGTLEVGGAGVASGASGFVWAEGPGPAPIGVTVVVPFTTPGITAGLLDAGSLDAYMSTGGVLRKKLDAVRGTPAAIALDPRIVASVRALGTSAPASALAWLTDLRAADNVIFPLSYADADLALERASGAPAVLTPGSFESSLDPADFTGTVPAGPANSASTPPTPVPTASPSPTPSAPPGGLPTADDLLAWRYWATDLAWPTSVGPGDLPFYAASGLRRAIVPSSALVNPPAALPATGTIEGSAALVLDSALSAAVSAAAFAPGAAEARTRLADATALLAASAVHARPGAAVLIGVARGWPDSTAGLESTLAALRAVPWATAIRLDALPPSAAALTVRGDHPADPRMPTATTLVRNDAAISRFASVVGRPELLTGRERLRLLAVLSAQWIDLPAPWQTAANDLTTRFEAILHSVTITQTSLLVLSPNVDVPVYVQNTLDFPVKVTLHGRPSNGRLLVDDATATIGAQSSQRVGLPARSIANGRVTLTVTALSPAGVLIGDPAPIALDVQAEWEAAGIAAVVGLVVALFGFGIYRNIHRRRRASADRAAE